MQNNLLGLGIPLERPDPSGKFGLQGGCALDFRFIYMRLLDHNSWTQQVNVAMTGLAQITGNRQMRASAERSVKEAKSVKALTTVGLIFIPLGYVAALFGMTAPFSPDGEKFGTTFAIAIPLVAVVLLSYYILNLGYDQSGMWSWNEFLKRLPFTSRHIRLRTGSVEPNRDVELN